MEEQDLVDGYVVKADEVPAKIEIRDEGKYVNVYNVKRPQPSAATEALMEEIKEETISKAEISSTSFEQGNEIEESREMFKSTAKEVLRNQLPNVDDSKRKTLIGNLMHEMLGLGDVEILLADKRLEEIVINSSEEPAWVYHRDLGWLKTNLTIDSENKIYNFASEIGRGVGKSISKLKPLLDAHLPSGDRANATLSPISTQGNTITIRKFSRDPWTITDFIESGTISLEMAAFLWECIQYEMSIIISGGTGSGKTSLLNVFTPFIPATQRIVSIEDTRELSLPDFLHWVPMTTREKRNDKGDISMQSLLVNSLRMRPDRILVGEIRKKKQAEVLFEAMQTGHSVYSTLHADTAESTIKRIKNPPIDIPEMSISSVDLNVVMFRDRRRNLRRVAEISEVVDSDENVTPHNLYAWNSQDDTFSKVNESKEIKQKLKRFTGLSAEEIEQDLEEKKTVLKWMVDNDVNDINKVGRVVAEYYSRDESKMLEKIKNGAEFDTITSTR